MIEITAFCFVLLALTAFVAAPLYARSSAPLPAPSPDAQQASRSNHEQALRDLEIDRASGLVSEEEYAAERAALSASAQPSRSGPSD
jgi:cytochrome c-type biogenesis protein CcmI